MQYCDDAAANLSSSLTELQTQHDSARDLIDQTFENYKKILEKCRDQALTDLEKLHSERELKIMDLMQNIENTMGKIDNTCKFTNRVLEQANATEFLALKKLIVTQFMNLINTTPKCDINYSLTFDTKMEKFEQMARDTFGKFRTESTPPSPKESTPPPTLPGMPPNMMNGGGRSAANNGHGGMGIMNCSNGSQGQLTSSVTASSPISLPTSMQSSFDGDIYALGNGFMMSNALTPESPPQNQNGGMPQQHHHHPSLQHQNSTSSHHSGISGSANGAFSSIGAIGAGPANNLANIGNGPNSLLNAGPLSSSQLGVTGLNCGNSSGPLLGSQGFNGLSAPVGHANGLGSVLNNSIAASLNSALGGNSNVPSGPPPPGYNSILEYNLSRLASLTEQTPDVMNDALVGAPGVPSSQPIVPATNAQNQPITLADLLSGDQRAFNNLQALTKLGLNSNGK